MQTIKPRFPALLKTTAAVFVASIAVGTLPHPAAAQDLPKPSVNIDATGQTVFDYSTKNGLGIIVILLPQKTYSLTGAFYETGSIRLYNPNIGEMGSDCDYPGQQKPGFQNASSVPQATITYLDRKGKHMTIIDGTTMKILMAASQAVKGNINPATLQDLRNAIMAADLACNPPRPPKLN